MCGNENRGALYEDAAVLILAVIRSIESRSALCGYRGIDSSGYERY